MAKPKSNKTKKNSTPRGSNKERLPNINLRYEQDIQAVESSEGAEIISVPFFSIFFDIDDYYYELALKWEPKTFVQDELTRMFEKDWVENPSYEADVALTRVLRAMLILKKDNTICWKWYRCPVRWRPLDTKITVDAKEYKEFQDRKEGSYWDDSWNDANANDATDDGSDASNEGWDSRTKEVKWWTEGETRSESRWEVRGEIWAEGIWVEAEWGVVKSFFWIFK